MIKDQEAQDGREQRPGPPTMVEDEETGGLKLNRGRGVYSHPIPHPPAGSRSKPHADGALSGMTKSGISIGKPAIFGARLGPEQ